MDSVAFLNIMLSLLAGLLSVLTIVFCWWASRLSDKIDDLMIHHQGCIKEFANDEDNDDEHLRIFGRLENLERSNHGHDIRIIALEDRIKRS